MRRVLSFDDEECSSTAVVGGKGANLSLLTGHGFPVPPGFTVTTEAYAEFRRSAGIDDAIASVVGTLNYDDADDLDKKVSDIRTLILEAPLPEVLVAEISDAYAKLGDDLYVAVRSSGTAEDLADASFAGLHDTYLDIRGRQSVLDAVRRCWASMWTARATAYRHANGFDHLEAGIAAVVQRMVESDVSGVMFTANPITTATDEIVIDASWGLGEAIVSGIVTPDHYVVSAETSSIRDRMIGSKSVRVVRDRAAPSGTVTEAVPDADQVRPALSDQQIVDLAALGRKIEAFYQGHPQDIEWAFAGGEIYLLQSRPVTGVEFSWDEDVNRRSELLSDDDDFVWTRSAADEYYTGVVSPLMFSYRLIMWSDYVWAESARVMGFEDIARMPTWRFHKGGAYFNATRERLLAERTLWPQLRSMAPDMILSSVPPEWRGDIVDAPFSPVTYFRMLARLRFLEPKTSGSRPVKNWHRWTVERADEVRGLSAEELRGLSDTELRRYLDKQLALEAEWTYEVTIGFLYTWRDALAVLSLMVLHWYDGDPSVYVTLVSGAKHRTATQRENAGLWKLAEQIRASATLRSLLEDSEDSDFFAALADSSEGREFLESYQEYLLEFGHRGHADRDIFYPRRIEDPTGDVRTFRSLINAKSPDPEQLEHAVNTRRDDAYNEVVANIRRRPFGSLKAELFKLAFEFSHKWIAFRDDQRHNPTDVFTSSEKRGFIEAGQRLHDQGLIDDAGDYLYLSYDELFDLLNGRAESDLLKVKIAARKRDLMRRYRKEINLPMYLQHGKELTLGEAADIVDGDVLQGVPTSPGVVTATARVVKNLTDIGKVKPGEILVTNSTDPGWTPIFMSIVGVVVETGGLLSHASCLAREYGFPAVQLTNAMGRIPDGATVTVSGATGTVSLINSDEQAPVLVPAT